MTGRRSISKAELLRWVDDDCLDLDAVATRILDKLARFADEECVGWATVETLAKAGRCSIRTAQYRLRLLAERGYIRDTGRRHRLSGSTRSVPMYLVGPLAMPDSAPAAAADRAQSMGAKAAPMGAHGCSPAPGMGATACTPNEQREPDEISDEISLRAREAFRRLERAYPRAGLGLTDGPMAWRAFIDLIAAGVHPEALIAAAERYAADPLLKRLKSSLVGLHRWLSEGRYRGWLSDEPDPAATPPPNRVRRFAGPAELRAEIAAYAGEAFAALNLDRAGWDRERREIRPHNAAAAAALQARAAHIIAKHGAQLAPVGEDA